MNADLLVGIEAEILGWPEMAKELECDAEALVSMRTRTKERKSHV